MPSSNEGKTRFHGTAQTIEELAGDCHKPKGYGVAADSETNIIVLFYVVVEKVMDFVSAKVVGRLVLRMQASPQEDGLMCKGARPSIKWRVKGHGVQTTEHKICMA